MPDGANANPAPKRVVYLWGAGATQAEISHAGVPGINLLMRDNDDLGEGVATRIIRKLERRDREAFTSDKGLDIEKLITLLSTSGVSSYQDLAEELRQGYFEDIRDNLLKAGILESPGLAIALLRLHDDPNFQQIEDLRGIITTNHDGLLQKAMQAVFGSVAIGFPFSSTQFVQADAGIRPLLQLHGSFTWHFALPLAVEPLRAGVSYSRDTVWIPPTVAKDAKAYPFNKLSGYAYELLAKQCDVLRVIGSALTQNDWNVLSMIFNAQRHNDLTSASSFQIELIMPPDTCSSIQEACSFLRGVIPIGHITDGDLAAYKDNTVLTGEMSNPMFFWLKQKIQGHIQRGQIARHALHDDIAAIVGDP